MPTDAPPADADAQGPITDLVEDDEAVRGRTPWTRWWHRRSRWFRIATLVFFVGGFLAFIALLGIVYAAAKIPLPGQIDTEQTTIVYYSDGKTEIGRLSAEVNRTDVPLKQMPQHLRDAVLAAEDRKFYEHSGVSIRGLARAAIADVRGGGAKQGGSTISQQYAKNAKQFGLSRQKTIARKFREAVIAIKLEREYDKDQILEFYLNTIYFGRGAYGVEAAARTYFGVPARRLTLEQSAFLAGIIQSPERYDPDTKNGRQGAEARFRYVLNGMVETGTLDVDKATTAKLPKARKRTDGAQVRGPLSYVLDAVRAELRAKDFTNDQIYTGGLRVTTTIDKNAQAAAVASINEFFRDQPKGLQQSLVSVEPGSGAIRALYAGRDEKRKVRIEFSGVYGNYTRQPGSSFKPYVLAAALDDGYSLKSQYSGASPTKPYPDKPEGFKNFGGASYGRLDLIQATAKSVNTAYVDLGNEVGLEKVVDAANKAGIRDREKLPKVASLPLGVAEVRVVDQAIGFATFANGGRRMTPYIVQQVKTKNDKTPYKAKTKATRAFDEDVAADVTHALTKVLSPGGTAPNAALDGGRPAAGKTGTTSENADAWFVGYTPQLSTAVWVGFENRKKELRQIEIAGERLTEVTGGRGPALVWKHFMDAAHKGQPVEEFPPPAFGGKAKHASPSPRPTTESPTPTPTPTPSPTPALPTPTKTKKPPGKPTPTNTLPPVTPSPSDGGEPPGEETPP